MMSQDQRLSQSFDRGNSYLVGRYRQPTPTFSSFTGRPISSSANVQQQQQQQQPATAPVMTSAGGKTSEKMQYELMSCPV
jgi:hypothetical protein